MIRTRLSDAKNVGVIVEDHTDAAYRKAASELKVLLEDVAFAERCRAAAEEHYAFDLHVNASLRCTSRFCEVQRPETPPSAPWQAQA